MSGAGAAVLAHPPLPDTAATGAFGTPSVAEPWRVGDGITPEPGSSDGVVPTVDQLQAALGCCTGPSFASITLPRARATPTQSTVDEPGSIALVVIGLVGAAVLHRREVAPRRRH